MTTAQFAYNPALGALVLKAYGSIPDNSPPLVVHGDEAQQGLMAAMVNAEACAAKAGFATPIVLGQTSGFLIGGARDKALTRPKDDLAATLYLAQCNAVRNALARTKAAPATAVATSYVEQSVLPLVPVLIVVAVVAVAAMVAVIYWKSTEKVQVEADSARTVGTIDKLLQANAAGQPIDPQVLAAITKLASDEQKTDAIPWPWIIGGGLVTAGLMTGTIQRFARQLFGGGRSRD
jgi:hypothetical protein